MAKLPKMCPACSAELLVTRLSCPDCGTEVTGQFSLDLFSRLPPHDFDFVVLFLRTRGNVKEMERELGISYWTIRSKLNEILERLGLESKEAAAKGGELSIQRQEILEQLNAGQISVQEAEALLEKLKKRS